MALADDARLAARVRRQAGAFGREQALAAGFTPGMIERRVRAGAWARVYPRVYRYATTAPGPRLLHWAAILWAGDGAVLSHESAAMLWGIRRPSGGDPELSVVRARAPRAAAVTVHRVTGLRRDHVTLLDGLPVTTPSRTIVDLAAVLDPEQLTRVLSEARSRRLVTVRAVLGCLDETGAPGRSGVTLLRALLSPIGSVRDDRSARMAG